MKYACLVYLEPDKLHAVEPTEILGGRLKADCVLGPHALNARCLERACDRGGDYP